ncbi:MAG: RNA polymerase sigma factor [Planctomycetales bacterium]|nr:RNA polymerase sigma factor [Planctomycetales bacterium]
MDEKHAGTVQLGSFSQMTDEQLVREYRSTGSETIFAELVGRYERELFNYLKRYLGDSALAEDVFQATFLQVHLKHDQFDDDRKFRPWLYTIATNQAIDAQRRNRRHRNVSLDQNVRSSGEDVTALIEMMENSEPGPVSQLEAEERREWVNQAVAELPDTLRTSVNLVYYQGLKYREAAQILSIPVGTVKSRLHAAILKLNEAWNSSHPWKTDVTDA